MPIWGNGSAAKTCEEAKAHWKQARRGTGGGGGGSDRMQPSGFKV